MDIYAKHTPGVSDPADNIYLITPDDDTDLTVGVKSLRLFNPTDSVATVVVTTVKGNTVTLSIPAGGLWVEALRVTRVKETGTTAEVIVHGYTDAPLPA